MKTIAIDVMGSDNGPKPIIEATLDFLSKNLDYKVILVGDKNLITTFVKEDEKITILNVTSEANQFVKAFNARDLTTSISQAIKLVKEKKADAVLTAGPSVAALTSATLILGRLPGISRPAFMCVMPTVDPKRQIVLLDCGANVSSPGETIAQWVYLAKIFVDLVFDIANPSIAMVNVGIENNKGLPFHQEVDSILKKDPSINYVGFIEPRDILTQRVHIVLTDGYGGNVLLKSYEGAILCLASMLKKNITKSFLGRIGALFLKKQLYSTFEAFDYRNYGAAAIIGVDGLVIKTHGSSDKKSYIGAFKQLKIQVEKDFMNKIRKERF